MKSIEEPTDLVCSDCGPVPSGSDNTVDNTADSIAADEGFADKMSFLKEKLLERNLYVNLQKENIDEGKQKKPQKDRAIKKQEENTGKETMRYRARRSKKDR